MFLDGYVAHCRRSGWAHARLLRESLEKLFNPNGYDRIGQGIVFERKGAQDIETFSIKPTHPETGYGYLELEKLDENLSSIISICKSICQINSI